MDTHKKLAAALTAGAGIWAVHRRRKYPLAKGFPPLEWFPLPGGLLTPSLAALGNRQLNRRQPPPPPQGIVRSRLTIPGEDGARIPLTLYRPEDANGMLPCLVYFHGGGFCFADAGYIHKNVADYARLAHCAVAFVHYRTSDRAPFPVPFQDCRCALHYVWTHSAKLGFDHEHIAVGGDSAGGALAAACTLWARDEGNIPLCFQLLLYPVTDARMRTNSMARYTDSPLWNARLNRKMWQLYLRRGDCGLRPYASPMEAGDFSRLPPAYVEVEQFDCLHDEGLAYARALRSAGVPVEFWDVQGTFHGFDLFRNTEKTQAALRTRARALRRAFHPRRESL